MSSTVMTSTINVPHIQQVVRLAVKTGLTFDLVAIGPTHTVSQVLLVNCSWINWIGCMYCIETVNCMFNSP